MGPPAARLMGVGNESAVGDLFGAHDRFTSRLVLDPRDRFGRCGGASLLAVGVGGLRKGLMTLRV